METIMQQFNGLSWEWALVLRVLVGFGLANLLIKWVASQGRRTERFFWQFAFAFAIAVSFAVATGGVQTNQMFWVFTLLGAVATAGTFYWWKATAMSQSRNALFTFWDDLIAMGLAYVILHEGQFITPPVALGIAISFLSVGLFIRHGYKKSKQKETAHETLPLRFYGYIAFYSVVWGVAYFGQRFWSHADLPISTFALTWYTGGLITATLVYLFYKDKAVDQQNAAAIGPKGIIACFTLAVALYASMCLSIAAYKAPQVVVQPIFFVSEMILPALIGLFIFRERKNFDRVEWLYFVIGVAGALMVGLSF